MKLERTPTVTALLTALLILTATCADEDEPTAPANTAPTACFTASLDSGTPETVFRFDASCSSDKEDATAYLEIRWDWENDGTWDTDWTTAMTATRQFTGAGRKTVRLEVRDTGGLTSRTTRHVEVPRPHPMVLVPAGTFTMGDGTADCGEDEHMVTLTHTFYIGRNEVTNQEYRDAVQWAYDQGYVTATPFSVRDNMVGSFAELVDLNAPDCNLSFEGGTFTVEPGKEDNPMIEVSWYGAARYCDWFSMQEHLPQTYPNTGDWACNGGDPYGAPGYRLPTDAEWEYAAQFDDERLYPWGDESPDRSLASYDNSLEWPAPVGSYPAAPPALGLHDMAGNVWEWCNDRHLCSLGTDPQTDPVGPSTEAHRVVRGGSWADDASCLRCAHRSPRDPSYTSPSLGFRIAKSIYGRRSDLVFQGSRSPAVDRIGGRLLRQRPLRVVLRNAGMRVSGSTEIQDSERSTDGSV